MAILTEIPCLEVTILVDGKALEEFDDPGGQSEQGQVTKYIRSTGDTNFGIEVKIKKCRPGFKYRKNDIRTTVQLDGALVYRGIRQKNNPTKDLLVTGTRENKNGMWTQRKFFFSDLVTDAFSSKPFDTKLLERMQNTGKITVCLWRVKCRGLTSAQEFEVQLGELGGIPEEALKGQSLSIASRLGTATKIEVPSTVSFRYIDSEDQPFAIFNFFYRSQHDLKCMRIVPRTPSPIPEVPLEDRSVDDLSVEQLRLLVQRQRDKQTKIKDERGKIKRENTLKRARDAMSSTMESDDELQFVGSTPVKKRYVPGDAKIINLD